MAKRRAGYFAQHFQKSTYTHIAMPLNSLGQSTSWSCNFLIKFIVKVSANYRHTFKHNAPFSDNVEISKQISQDTRKRSVHWQASFNPGNLQILKLQCLSVQLYESINSIVLSSHKTLQEWGWKCFLLCLHKGPLIKKSEERSNYSKSNIM